MLRRSYDQLVRGTPLIAIRLGVSAAAWQPLQHPFQTCKHVMNSKSLMMVGIFFDCALTMVHIFVVN